MTIEEGAIGGFGSHVLQFLSDDGLLDRGLKTLPLRMKAHNDNALQLARYLEGNAAVELVHYPGLESHPHHARSKRLFAGCGGMLAFALLALPFAPCGARLSLDSLIARWREAARHRRRLTPPDEAEDANLPILFMQITVALGYLFAGTSKLMIGGPEWLNGYTLQSAMLEFDAPLTRLLERNN